VTGGRVWDGAAPEAEVLAAAYRLSRWLTRAVPGRPRRTPMDHGLSFDRAECRTADGLRLVGWAAAPALPRATVVLFHDVRGGREAMLPRLALLAAAGYRCLAFDHRAHGESDGRRTSFGYHEARDVAAVLALARRNWPGQALAALGVGMGAAALCFAAGEVRGVRAVVLEGLYPDLGSALLGGLGGAGCPRWFRRLGQAVARVTECRLGVRLAAVAPVRHLGGLGPTPVLLLAGDEDRHAPAAGQRLLFDHCRGPRELHRVPRAGRHDLVERGGPFYREPLLAFLDRHLVRSGRRAA
jgi:alpha-beta hydrolase superfamily lysophospholipase